MYCKWLFQKGAPAHRKTSKDFKCGKSEMNIKGRYKKNK